MGIEQTAQYYDTYKNYKNQLYIYREMVGMLPRPDECGKVVDLGCGTGGLAKEMLDSGYDLGYVGVDFSSERVNLARKLVPAAEFIVADLRSPEVRKLYKPQYVYVLMDTLEHINSDIELIEAIPSGALVLFSVPSHDDVGHVRWFDSPQQAFGRYKHLLAQPDYYKTIEFRTSGNNMFIIKTRRT